MIKRYQLMVLTAAASLHSAVGDPAVQVHGDVPWTPRSSSQPPPTTIAGEISTPDHILITRYPSATTQAVDTASALPSVVPRQTLGDDSGGSPLSQCERYKATGVLGPDADCSAASQTNGFEKRQDLASLGVAPRGNKQLGEYELETRSREEVHDGTCGNNPECVKAMRKPIHADTGAITRKRRDVMSKCLKEQAEGTMSSDPDCFQHTHSDGLMDDDSGIDFRKRQDLASPTARMDPHKRNDGLYPPEFKEPGTDEYDPMGGIPCPSCHKRSDSAIDEMSEGSMNMQVEMSKTMNVTMSTSADRSVAVGVTHEAAKLADPAPGCADAPSASVEGSLMDITSLSASASMWINTTINSSASVSTSASPSLALTTSASTPTTTMTLMKNTTGQTATQTGEPRPSSNANTFSTSPAITAFETSTSERSAASSIKEPSKTSDGVPAPTHSPQLVSAALHNLAGFWQLGMQLLGLGTVFALL